MKDSLISDVTHKITTEITSMSVLELLLSGGIIGNIIMLLLLVLFVIACYIFFERYFIIGKSTRSNSDLIKNIGDFVHDGKLESAIDLCKRTSTPEARMIKKGLTRIGRNIAEIKDSIEQTGQLEIYKLEKNINILATVAGVAPMLGFLGTVFGMIMSFYEMANHTGQGQSMIKVISSGIYTAMSTTAVGLIVGISAYIFYNILVTKVAKTVFLLQSSVNDFLDLLNKPLK